MSICTIPGIIFRFNIMEDAPTKDTPTMTCSIAAANLMNLVRWFTPDKLSTKG
jgi:hypothetical protein